MQDVMNLAERGEGVYRSRFWAWMPLLTAALATYGPVGNNYGFALYFLSWKHGFVKRGLIGEMFAGAGFMGRGTLLTVELLFIVAAYALTYVVFRRLLFARNEVSVFAAMLLAAPGVLPHIGFLFAQPDVTLYLIVLLCVVCWVRLPAAYAVWTVCALSCVGMLAHEAFSLMFYPLMVAVMWRKYRRGELAWVTAGLSMLVVAAAWAAIMHFGALKVSPDVVHAEAVARTNVPVQRQVYDVMSYTLEEQWALVRRMYNLYMLRMVCVTLVLCGPYFWLLGKVSGVVLAAESMRRMDRVVFAVLMLCPMVLCAFGHDITRWIGAACVDVSMYVLYVLLADDAGVVRAAVSAWVGRTNVFAWIAYLLVIGPMGATGLRAGELLDVLWQGR